MTGHDFNVESGKIRDLCDPMSVAQMKALIDLLGYDVQAKKDGTGPL